MSHIARRVERQDDASSQVICEPEHGGWHMGTLVGTKIAGEALGARGRAGSSS
jgi:hypothetical protein